MKFGKLLFAGMFILILGDAAIAQEDPVSLYQANYERAIRYNDRVEAKSALYKLISINPQSDSLMTTLAYLYFEARQYASSVLVCMDILAINPKNGGALEMGAMSYENLGLKDKALDNFEKLYLLSDDFQALYKMAFLQFDLAKYRQCTTNIEILLQAPEAEEATVFYTIGEEEKEFSVKVALINLKGLVNKEQGNEDLARQDFEEVLKMAPDEYCCIRIPIFISVKRQTSVKQVALKQEYIQLMANKKPHRTYGALIQ